MAADMFDQWIHCLRACIDAEDSYIESGFWRNFFTMIIMLDWTLS